MWVFYQTEPVAPGLHRIALAIWDAELPTFDRTTLAVGHSPWHFDELQANLPTLAALKAALSRPRRLGEVAPAPWRFVAAGGLRRPEGSTFTPAVNLERATLFQPLPGGQTMVAALDQIIASLVALPESKVLARVLRRVLRHIRQREGEGSDD